MIRRTFIASLLALPSVLLLRRLPKTIVSTKDCQHSSIIARNVSDRTIQKGEPVYWSFDNATARWGVVGRNPGTVDNADCRWISDLIV